jgi:hypothetical protein
MGRESAQQTTPDLFSTDAVRDVSAESMERSSGRMAAAATPSKRHVLPENLDRALKQLTDEELMQLLEVAIKEAKQRGKLTSRTDAGSMQSSRPTEEVRKNHRSPEKASKQVDAAAVTLSPGKLNAVRAAFKAGVTPVRIARQFGISQMNVRKALASDDRS